MNGWTFEFIFKHRGVNRKRRSTFGINSSELRYAVWRVANVNRTFFLFFLFFFFVFFLFFLFRGRSRFKVERPCRARRLCLVTGGGGGSRWKRFWGQRADEGRSGEAHRELVWSRGTARRRGATRQRRRGMPANEVGNDPFRGRPGGGQLGSDKWWFTVIVSPDRAFGQPRLLCAKRSSTAIDPDLSSRVY